MENVFFTNALQIFFDFNNKFNAKRSNNKISALHHALNNLYNVLKCKEWRQ